MKKGTKLYSIFSFKCPKCHEGNLFNHPNPYNLPKIYDMPKTCDCCGQRFEIEPGFYYGAMYVSYALSIAWLVSVFVALLVLYPSFSVEEYLIIGLSSLFLIGPYMFRLSRSVYINFFIHYDPKAAESCKSSTAKTYEEAS